MRKIKVGIVGCGGISRTHVPILARAELCTSHIFIHPPPVLKATELMKNGSSGGIIEV